MFRLVALMEARFEELAQLVTRENGKTLEDARGEIRRGIDGRGICVRRARAPDGRFA